MQQTIEYDKKHATTLIVSGRKKSLYGMLLAPISGGIIVRIGHTHYYLQSGDLFWINIDCLHSLIVLPETEWQQIQVSIRSQSPLPQTAGFLSNSQLIQACFSTLTESPSDALKSSLIKTIHLHLAAQQPQQNAKDRAINVDCMLQGDMSELKIALSDSEKQRLLRCIRMTEAVRAKRSGKSVEHIVQDLQLTPEELRAEAQELLQERW
ncbi:AraC family ligand binding domain-containing protein [Thaumasiovibrio sp. DFM-14]|uniref:AraC family ligand binding domain-containing protein n=1 Tax=Thaumasiovibrio sp. DFM-14 TaxID=3384792 RepID=UPI0039A04F97